LMYCTVTSLNTYGKVSAIIKTLHYDASVVRHHYKASNSKFVVEDKYGKVSSKIKTLLYCNTKNVVRHHQDRQVALSRVIQNGAQLTQRPVLP